MAFTIRQAANPSGEVSIITRPARSKSVQKLKRAYAELSAKEVRERLVDTLFQQVLDDHHHNDA